MKQHEESGPFLDIDERVEFLPACKAPQDVPAGSGGNLSPGFLLSAYEQGYFPWFNKNDPILWWSPDPRCVVFTDTVRPSASMQKVLKKARFTFRFDTNFDAVIRACSSTRRPGQRGTWIHENMIAAYCELHRQGWAHSVEAYLEDGTLAGGLYGVSIGDLFCGESMFFHEENASKACFLVLVANLRASGVELIDSQVINPHMESLGARNVPRDDYLARLPKLPGEKPRLFGSWTQRFSGSVTFS